MLNGCFGLNLRIGHLNVVGKVVLIMSCVLQGLFDAVDKFLSANGNPICRTFQV